mgnify:CR=1 FL=1
MKKTFSLLLFIFCSLSLCAENNVQNKWSDTWCDTWNVAMMFRVGPDKQVTTYRYQLVQDTVVDGQTYTVLNCKATAEPNTLNIDLGIVRFADDRKVYANYNGKEYLVYDFSVQIGDTLDVLINAWGDDTQKCLVHNVSIDEESNRTIITLHVYHEYRKEFIEKINNKLMTRLCARAIELYKKAICQKKYELFENGCHAEDLFIQDREKFIKLCTDWLFLNN